MVVVHARAIANEKRRGVKPTNRSDSLGCTEHEERVGKRRGIQSNLTQRHGSGAACASDSACVHHGYAQTFPAI